MLLPGSHSRLVAVRRRQLHIVVGLGEIVDKVALRLDTHEGLTQTNTGDHQPTLAAFGVFMRCAPARPYGFLQLARQGLKPGQVVVNADALPTGALVEAGVIVGYRTLKLADQFIAVFRQLA